MQSAYSPAAVKAAVALATTRQLALRRQRDAIALAPEPDESFELAARRDRARRDPEWFAGEILGVKPYAKQIELVEAVRDNDRASVVGANAVGKDWTIGNIVIPWWMYIHEDFAKAIVTGPTNRQVDDIVFSELRSAYQNSRYPLGGTMLPARARWRFGPNKFAYGFATDKPLNILGYHSPHLLVLITEAHNFPDDYFKQVQRLHPEKMLLSGNPLAESGEFHASHHEKRPFYQQVVITAYDSPNVQQGETVIPGLVTQHDIDVAASEYGEESEYFKATFKAEFVGRPDGLIPLAWLLAATAPAVDQGGPLWGGVDAAGPGEDETVLTIAEAQTVDGEQKDAIILQKGWRKAEAEGDVIAELLPYAPRLQAIGVDSIGLGESWPRIINQALIEAGYKAVARGINVAVSPTSDHNKRNYDRLKDQLYFGLRDRFKGSSIIGLTTKAAGQLASMRYRNNLRGKKQVESKDEMTKRGVPSPDWGESTMLLFAVMGAGLVTDAPDEDELTSALRKLRETDKRPGEMPFSGIRGRTF